MGDDNGSGANKDRISNGSCDRETNLFYLRDRHCICQLWQNNAQLTGAGHDACLFLTGSGISRRRVVLLLFSISIQYPAEIIGSCLTREDLMLVKHDQRGLFKRSSKFYLNPIGVAKAKNCDAERREISHLSVFNAVLFEERRSPFEFRAVSHAKTEMV